MLEEQEWLFFEATEQRIKAWTRKHRENARALWGEKPLPHDPQALAAKRASIIQEMDYPDRLEAALRREDLLPDKRRRLELHQRWVVETAFRTHPEMVALENDLRQAMARFEPRVGDRPLDWAGVETVLREEPDRDRREEAWKAAQPLALDLEERMGELFQLREAWARSIVGTGFSPVAYHVQELERTFVVNLIDEVERTTRSAMPGIMEQLSRAAEVPDLEPWDTFYGLNQWWSLSREAFDPGIAWESAELQARRFGWEPGAVSITWDDAPHPGRSRAWGSPGEAVLLSRSGPGPWSFDRLFRAYGNAMHRALIPESRFFIETPPQVQTEATGVWFARVLADPRWLDEHSGAGAQAIDRAVEVLRAAQLLRLRWHLAHNAFENVAYTHAQVEPTRLFQDVLEQIFQGTRQQSVAWAAMRSYVETPMSQAAPIVGAVMGAQLWDVMETDEGEQWRSEKAGARMLAEWIQPGAAEPWPQALSRVTGSAVNLRGICRWLGLDIFEGPRLDESESVSDAQAEDYFKDIDLSDLDL